MLILALLGFIVFDLVYITALINYAAQSELIISFIKVVRICILQRRYHTFDEALNVCNSYSYLANECKLEHTIAIL